MKKEPTQKQKTDVVNVEPLPMVTYTMRAVIRTGEYSNVQPEITIMAKTLEEASAIMLPHVDMLYSKYFDFTVKKVSVAPTPIPVTNDSKITINEKDLSFEDLHQYIQNNQSPAYAKAKGMVDACQNAEALELIDTRIRESKTLTDSEKRILMVEIEAKKNKLHGK